MGERRVFQDSAAAKGVRLMEVTEEVARAVLAGEQLIIEGTSAQEEAVLTMKSSGSKFVMKVADTSNLLLVSPPPTQEGKLISLPFTSTIEATKPLRT